MDYEKKYKEALEKARQLCAYPTSKPFISDLQDIFPELKESEDEKIRKRIIHALHGDVLEMSEIKEAVAWLEKQGEPTDIPADAVLDSNKDGLIADTIRCKIEKQGENKPADKVEPKFKVGDKIYLKPEYRKPNDDTPIANTVFEIRRIDDKYYRFDRSYIFIEDQDKYELVEQKSAWSEEDETITSALSQLIKDCELENNWNCVYSNDREVFFVDIGNWLKSLKDRVLPQPKQEWSEEDEKCSSYICAALDCYYRLREDRNNTNGQEDLDKARNWLYNKLKFLRPQSQWKPSEEHYELEEFAKIVRGNLTGISKAVQKLFEAKYLQLTGNKMYGGFKD